MLDAIYNRHSIRKFKDQLIPEEDLLKILDAGIQAPSGKNIQNWHFVLISNKEKIQQISQIVKDKNEWISSQLEDQETANKFRKYCKYHTVFENAPHLLLIYASSYPTTGLDLLVSIGACEEDIKLVENAAPGIQNIAAAMENIQLAASAMGYGGVWMTGPNYAAKEIQSFINIEMDDMKLACMTPLGIPLNENNPSPKRKALNEVLTQIK